MCTGAIVHALREKMVSAADVKAMGDEASAVVLYFSQQLDTSITLFAATRLVTVTKNWLAHTTTTVAVVAVAVAAAPGSAAVLVAAAPGSASLVPTKARTRT